MLFEVDSSARDGLAINVCDIDAHLVGSSPQHERQSPFLVVNVGSAYFARYSGYVVQIWWVIDTLDLIRRSFESG